MAAINEALGRLQCRTIPCSMKMGGYPPKSQAEADWMMQRSRRKWQLRARIANITSLAPLHAGTGNVTYVASDNKDTDLFLSCSNTKSGLIGAFKEHPR